MWAVRDVSTRCSLLLLLLLYVDVSLILLFIAVDLPRGQKISRKWLVSWKPVSENNDQNMPMNIPSDAGAANDESPNDGTNIVYFDPNTGMTFNVNTSIQSIGGKELHGKIFLGLLVPWSEEGNQIGLIQIYRPCWRTVWATCHEVGSFELYDHK